MSPTFVVPYVAVLVLLTALPTGVGQLLGLEIWPAWSAFVAVALLVPAYIFFASAVKRRAEVQAQVLLVSIGLLTGCWLNAVSWSAVGAIPALAAVLLIGMTCAGAFNDAQALVDTRALLLPHIGGFVIVDVCLLLWDALGGEGLIHLMFSDGMAATTWLVLQGLAVSLAVSILGVVGRLSRERRERVEEVMAARQSMELLTAERNVVRRTCNLMLGGLEAGRFSHDVKGPLTSLRLILQMLDSDLEDGSLTLDGLASSIGELQSIERDLVYMASFMVEGLKGEHVASPTPVVALVEGSVGLLPSLLSAHDRSVPTVNIDLVEADVVVEPLHRSAIANVLANGALQAPGCELSVTGRLLDDGDYELRLRDRGAHGQRRSEAMRHVRNALSLAGEQEQRPDQYRGEGLGLLLAKIIAERNGGTLTVEMPDDGPGLILAMRLTTPGPNRPRV